jgi:hypothetical protein
MSPTDVSAALPIAMPFPVADQDINNLDYDLFNDDLVTNKKINDSF